jgi:orotate phosphoribosyltransferase
MEETAFRFSPEDRGLLARLLVDCGAYQRGTFTLASGKTSDTYIDVKRGLTRPDILALIANAMAPHIDSDRIAGVELAGVPIAAAVSLAVDKPCIYVRKQPKDHGTKSRIEGDLRPGESVTFVEDVTTTGGSVISAIEAVKSAGAQVDRVVAVVDRDEGAEDALFKIGVELVAVLDLPTLKRTHQEMEAYRAGQRRR